MIISTNTRQWEGEGESIPSLHDDIVLSTGRTLSTQEVQFS